MFGNRILKRFTLFLIFLFAFQTVSLAGGGTTKKEGGSSPRNALLKAPSSSPELTGVLHFDKKLLSQNQLPDLPKNQPVIEFSDDELFFLGIAGVAVATFLVTYFIKGDFVEALKTYGKIAGSAALLLLAATCCLG